MPRTLFEELTVSSRKSSGARGLRALPVSLVIHALAVSAVAFVAARPAASELEEPAPGVLVLPVGPKPAPVRAESRPTARAPRRRAAPESTGGQRAVVPATPPDGVQQEVDTEAPCLTNCGDGPDTALGSDGGEPGGAGARDGGGEGIGPRIVGGEIHPPRKVTDVLPIYPELARRARVQGIVIVQCVIDESGRVVDTRVLKGHALLEEAALEAVRQWSYEPTRLNGKPVPVVMTVTVRFLLQRY